MISMIHCAACGEPLEKAFLTCPSCGESTPLAGPDGARWILLKVLGKGSFGCTWQAAAISGVGTQVTTGPEVFAIKEMPVAGLDLKQRELLEREAQVLMRVRHPCIPTLHAHFSTGKGRDRRVWLVLDLMPGPTLRREMSTEAYGLPEVLAILGGVLDILVYLHELEPPVVHRDLKPENLIRNTQTGRWCLVDFGSVRDRAKGTLGGSTVAGTFEYMAPEQFAGDASPATDLWALGVIGVELLTRQRLVSMRLDQYRFDWERHVQAPATVKLLLGRMLTSDVQKRASNAREVLTELTHVITEIPADAHPPRSPIPTRPRTPVHVQIPKVQGGGAVGRTVQALQELRAQREVQKQRAKEEAARQEQEEREREVRATKERAARAARLAAEEREREEERRMLEQERQRQIEQALALARQQVEYQALTEWGSVVGFLAEISQQGQAWDERARGDGAEAVRVWLGIYGELPPVIVGVERHALELPVGAEARLALGFLTGSGEMWPERPEAGARHVVTLDSNLRFRRVKDRVQVQESFLDKEVTRRFLGVPVASQRVERTRVVSREVTRLLAFGDCDMAFCWCPPGGFEMGSDPGEADRSGDEGPRHEVRIATGFWMGATPVTQAQYKALMGGKNPSHFKEDDTLPVENLDWNQAVAFCEALSHVLGCRARLPRESEWEYACRAGTSTRFWSGDSEEDLARVGWYDKNSGGKTHPVGQKPANPWGLQDVHGSVWEWCADAYGTYGAGLERVDPTTDPPHPVGGDRAVRGGSSWYDARGCRSAFRGAWAPGFRVGVQGFRVLVPAPPSRR